MVHWVYVLECEGENIYIGETTRLFKRFLEHQKGGGAVNTHKHSPERLIALYKVSDNVSFEQYRRSVLENKFDEKCIQFWGGDDSGNLTVENHITEMFMYQRDNMADDFMYNDGEWYKVKGGKYTKYISENPTLSMDSQTIIDRPNCHCQVPSEVKISKDKKTIYFVCSLKNVWDDFYKYLKVDVPCDYYSVYSDDTVVRTEYNIARKKINEPWCIKIPTTNGSIFPDPCVLCKTSSYKPHYSSHRMRRVCQECILNKYDELKLKYASNGCMINDDE
jgi:hypothetical protein